MILDHINKIPPFICIAMARKKGGKGFTREQIAEKSGVHVNTITRLAGKLEWDGYSIDIIDKVSAACGVDLNNQRDAWAYLKKTLKARNPFNHLNSQARIQVKKLLKKWIEQQSASEGDGDDTVS